MVFIENQTTNAMAQIKAGDQWTYQLEPVVFVCRHDEIDLSNGSHTDHHEKNYWIGRNAQPCVGSKMKCKSHGAWVGALGPPLCSISQFVRMELVSRPPN